MHARPRRHARSHARSRTRSDLLALLLLAGTVAIWSGAPEVFAQPDAGSVTDPTAQPGADAAGEDATTPSIDDAARAVLERCAAAADAAGGLEASFTISGEAPGLFAQTVPSGTGTLRLVRRPPTQPGGPFTLALRATGTGRPTAATATDAAFEVAFQPGRLSFLDHDKRAFIERPIDGRAPAGVSAGYAFARGNITLDTLIAPRLFVEDLAQAASVTLDPQPITLDGQECDRVLIRMPKPEGGRAPGRARADLTIWSIARSDGLPRRVEFVSETGMGNLSRTLSFEQVRVRPELEPADVVLSAPEGYTTDSTFAPRPARPSTTVSPAPAGTEEPAPGSGSQPPPEPARPLNPLPPPFTLISADGASIDASTLRGRPAVLFFGGTWSLAWRDSTPTLRALASDLSTRAAVVGVFYRERTPGTISAAEHEPMTIVPAGDAAAGAFGVKVVPTAIVLDTEARIAARVELAPGQDSAAFAAAVRAAFDALPKTP